MTNNLRLSRNYDNKMMVAITENNFTLIVFGILCLKVKKPPSIIG